LSGDYVRTDLSGELRLDRDAEGRISIYAASEKDAAFAIGFAHGQDRFLQMDLMRRASAGELSELIGADALKIDKDRRLHRMRHRAQQVYTGLPQSEQTLLEKYAEGVNAGLMSIGKRPFTYVLLRAHPKEWTPIDSILVGFAMFFDLQEDLGWGEEIRAVAQAKFPAEIFQFLYRNGFAHSVPIEGEPLPILPPPPFEKWPLRDSSESTTVLALPESYHLGSNAWAVSNQLSEGDAALLAVDMHLGMSTPNVWYRAHIEIVQNELASVITGVSLPGVPGLVIGSNGHIAWGFTNAYIDLLDLVEIVEDPDMADHYVTANGSAPLSVITEWIAVKGADPVALPVRESRFGPLRRSIDDQRWYAVQWIAHRSESFNMSILDLAAARGIDEAITIAQRAGIPTQNFVVADANGGIAWTLCGAIPDRHRHSGSLPLRSDDPRALWSGRLPAEYYPVVRNPQSGRIWTANNPIIESGPDAALLGDGGYSDDGRASVIREALFAGDSFNEFDFLQIQLSTRSHMLIRWQQVFAAAMKDPQWQESGLHRRAVYDAVVSWDGHAEPDCFSFPLVRDLQSQLAREVIRKAYAPLSRKKFRPHYLTDVRRDEVLYQLVTAGDPRIADAPDGDWQLLVRDLADKVIGDWVKKGQIPGHHRYRDEPPPRFSHPLSRAVPALSRWLDMPAVALPGHRTTPRTQTRSLTASQRMVLRPGFEHQGILQVPAGPSDHFLSPFYRSGHADWVSGNPTSLMHGPPIKTIRWSTAWGW
jgi:penicillin amidase